MTRQKNHEGQAVLLCAALVNLVYCYIPTPAMIFIGIFIYLGFLVWKAAGKAEGFDDTTAKYYTVLCIDYLGRCSFRWDKVNCPRHMKCPLMISWSQLPV